MHEGFGIRTNNKNNVFRDTGNEVESLDCFWSRLVLAIDFAHWNHSFLVDYDDSLLGALVASFDHAELEFLEPVLEFDDALICSEACLLVGIDIHGVVGSLQVYQELLTPLDCTVPLDIPEHLVHSFKLFIGISVQYLGQVVRDVLHVEWIYDESPIQLPRTT